MNRENDCLPGVRSRPSDRSANWPESRHFGDAVPPTSGITFGPWVNVPQATNDGRFLKTSVWSMVPTILRTLERDLSLERRSATFKQKRMMCSAPVGRPQGAGMSHRAGVPMTGFTGELSGTWGQPDMRPRRSGTLWCLQLQFLRGDVAPEPPPRTLLREIASSAQSQVIGSIRPKDTL